MTPSGDAGPSRRGAAAYRVSLANRQRQVAIRTDRLRRLATRVLRAARPGGGELSVLLVDDAAIAELNGAYRGRPQPTDVLSFSQLDLSAGAPSGATAPKVGAPSRPPMAPAPPRSARAKPGPRLPVRLVELLGDVVISVETARRQAREWGRPLEEEMAALLIHGVLHLLGHDHERGSAEARRMFACEREVAAAIGLPALALGDQAAAQRGSVGRGERR